MSQIAAKKSVLICLGRSHLSAVDSSILPKIVAPDEWDDFLDELRLTATYADVPYADESDTNTTDEQGMEPAEEKDSQAGARERIKNLIEQACPDIHDDDLLGRMANWFLPYSGCNDTFILDAVKTCRTADPFLSFENFSLALENYNLMVEGIPLILKRAEDEIIVKSFGVGMAPQDLKQVTKLVIEHCDKIGRKINIRLFGFDVKEDHLWKAERHMQGFIDSTLPGPWRRYVTYRSLYGNITNKAYWKLMNDYKHSDISILQNSWVARPLGGGYGKLHPGDSESLFAALRDGLNRPGILIVNEKGIPHIREIHGYRKLREPANLTRLEADNLK